MGGASAAVRPLSPAAAALAVVLCLSWAFNQVAVKLALPEIPPFVQAAFRSSLGALVVVIWARGRGSSSWTPTARSFPASSPACCSASSSC